MHVKVHVKVPVKEYVKVGVVPWRSASYPAHGATLFFPPHLAPQHPPFDANQG